MRKLLIPKYREGDKVNFKFGKLTGEGIIVVVDRGIFADPYNVYYDIKGCTYDNAEIMWFKHIPENDVMLKEK